MQMGKHGFCKWRVVSMSKIADYCLCSTAQCAPQGMPPEVITVESIMSITMKKHRSMTSLSIM